MRLRRVQYKAPRTASPAAPAGRPALHNGAKASSGGSCRRRGVEIAAEITVRDAAADPGDGTGPADTDAGSAAFATAIRGTWLRGDRGARSAGPVRSSRFA